MSTWCRPATQDDPARCHPDSAAGITTATYVDDSGSIRDGAIVDADIEINGVDFAISSEGQTLSTQTCLSELKNTLTHELGHLLGLEHTCRASGDPARIDDKGAAVPSCNAVMSNPAYGYSNVPERWAVRISDNGEFIDQNQDTVADQGVVNVSHGCINLSAESAQAYFESAIYGDPVQVTGTSVQLSAADGDIYDWAMSWEEWKALAVT